MFKKNHGDQDHLSTYEIKDKKLLLKVSEDNSIKEISFDFPIRQVVTCENKIFVRLEPDIGSILNENVYCYSSDGIFLWQVQSTNTIDTDCPYTNVVIRDDKLFLYNWSGEKIQINLNNGKILKKEFTK